MSNLNINQSHPLIPREQTYFLDRKILSVHSYDRDYKKWPNANHFEVMLPETLKNIQSIRLNTISLPNTQYVFNNEYQNTKMSFSLEDASGTQTVFTITIDDGTYLPEELAIEIQTKMNSMVVQQDASRNEYVGFKCKYNKASNTFWFGNTEDLFELRFNVRHNYEGICNGQEIMFNHYTKWGLPAYLGYNKEVYRSTPTPAQVKPDETIPQGGLYGFDYEYPVAWLDGDTNYIVDVKNPYPSADYLSGDNVNKLVEKEPYLRDASGVLKQWQDKNKICNIDIMGEDYIYMELDRYNSMDEIEPYSENTSGVSNNDYNGKVKSAFAKIPVPCMSFSQVYDTKNASLMNISLFEPPIERLSKLKFKFRYHDGRLVDFKCVPLSFTLEFNMLRDEQLRARTVRMSGLYR